MNGAIYVAIIGRCNDQHRARDIGRFEWSLQDLAAPGTQRAHLGVDVGSNDRNGRAGFEQPFEPAPRDFTCADHHTTALPDIDE